MDKKDRSYVERLLRSRSWGGRLGLGVVITAMIWWKRGFELAAVFVGIAIVILVVEAIVLKLWEKRGGKRGSSAPSPSDRDP